METVIKTAALGAVISAMALLIKKNSPELALLLAAAGVCAIAAMAMTPLRQLIGYITELTEEAGINAAVLLPVLKGMGIGVITRIASAVCRDAGQSAVASAVELCGCAAAVCVALPLMKTVIGIVLSVMQ